MSRSRPGSAIPFKTGFTLVELLVAIAVIGVLIALLLPAVQAARESARRTSCANHVRQLGVGCLSHLSSQQFFPSGGWRASGLDPFQGMVDPDRGFGKQQPGSWVYNILPYMEQKQLREFGKGQAPAKKRDAIYHLVGMPLEWMYCPTRRTPVGYPFYYGDPEPPAVMSGVKSDYAANCGLYALKYSDPEGGAEMYACHGVVFQRSTTKVTQVTDGLSNTILLGEKYLNPDHYRDGRDLGDNACVYSGFDDDTLRSAYYEKNAAFDPGPFLGDHSGISYSWNFGSAHRHSAHFIFCDGSVHAVQYDIDRTLFNYLGNRGDHHPVPAQCYD